MARHTQQYLKVFIAYLQVLGSFVTFKVVWPSFLGDGIRWVKDVSNMIKFDIMELPRCTQPPFGKAPFVLNNLILYIF